MIVEHKLTLLWLLNISILISIFILYLDIYFDIFLELKISVAVRFDFNAELNVFYLSLLQKVIIAVF